MTPLFVTRSSLSNRTAIGVQTRQIVEHFQTYRHLFWHDNFFGRAEGNSERIESLAFSKLPFLKRGGRRSSLLQVFGGYWVNDRPSSRLESRLKDIGYDTSAIYFAPIDSRDAMRMRYIAEIMDKPFVLHIWDFLNGNSDPNLLWLLDKAEHIFCLNRTMLKDIDRTNASILSFTRPPCHIHAHHGRSTKIALLGDIRAYREGVSILLEAVNQLVQNGMPVEIIFMGKRNIARETKLDEYPFVNILGFVESEAEKDRIISECTIGFLPGPLKDPASDHRSRYSIPSRVLDFMANGLPIMGAIHPQSATFDFLSDVGLGAHLENSTSRNIVDKIIALSDEVTWNRESEISYNAFNILRKNYNIKELQRYLLQKDYC